MNLFKFIYTVNETEPELARREYITRNVIFFSFSVTFSFALISFILHLSGKMPLDTLLIYSIESIILVVAMYLAEAGYWRLVGIIPPLLMYFPAVNANYIGGIDAPGNFMYALLIMFVAIIYGYRKMWIALVICLETYLCLAWMISSGYIKPFRTAEVFFVNRVVLTSGFLVGIALMIWLLGRSYRSEVDVRIKAEELLNRKNEELGALNESLRESEERFRALSENTPDIIYTMNLDGAITYMNPSWKRILGHGEEDLMGRYFTDFAKEEDRRIYRKLFKSIRDDGKSVNNHIGVMLTKNGEERVFNMNSAFNRDLEGRIIGVVGTMKDITELRDMEKKLNHAQKMESIGTLAGGIAHDFNNLLMGIQGYTSLTLLNLDPSHPNYERLKRIEEQVQSGADLTRQLLGFARGGRYEVKPVNMNDILEKTSSMFERTKKEISIHRKYGKDLWSVEVDRGQMEQVFMNLYVNAWQAMPGGGEIYLETEKIILDDEQALSYAVAQGRYIKISMADTGTGMDEKTRERIFDPFFTTKEMGRGTGLGLATVYGIIKGHGGMINVDSEPGCGTTFTVYLPASKKELANEKPATGIIVRGTETILLVDDEKMVLEVSKELLESMGYRVYAVGSGQEAIAVFMEKRNGIDLVILDMIMPGISGGETFDRLREINPKIKVLLSSGYSLTGQAQEILDRSCNGFIQKPFHLSELSGKVREILD